jgi:hypothetical protein
MPSGPLTLRPQSSAERWHTSVALTWHSKCEGYQGRSMLILKKGGFFVGLLKHGRRGMHKNTQSKGGAFSKTSSSVQRESRDRGQPETTARAPCPRVRLPRPCTGIRGLGQPETTARARA